VVIFGDVILPKRGPIKIIVSPSEKQFIVQHLTLKGVPFSLVNGDIERLVYLLNYGLTIPIII